MTVATWLDVICAGVEKLAVSSRAKKIPARGFTFRILKQTANQTREKRRRISMTNSEWNGDDSFHLLFVIAGPTHLNFSNPNFFKRYLGV